MADLVLTLKHFFEEARAGRLTGIRCGKCGELAIPPKEFCPACQERDWTPVPLAGVGIPGHFVVKFPDATSRLFIDAFDGGRILDVPDCVALVERQTHGRITWSDDFLEPVTSRAILKRVLVNLKNTLTHAKNYASALTAIELQLKLDPGDPTELRDRGILFARLHRYDRAIADFEEYLERSPDASDVKQIRERVLRYLREVSNSKMSMNMVFYIREAIYDRLQRVGFGFHDALSSGQLINRALTDLQNVRGFVQQSVLQSLEIVLIVVGYEIQLISMNSRPTFAAGM